MGKWTFRNSRWTLKQRWTTKWWRTPRRRWRRISSQKHMCAFWCPLAMIPLEPMYAPWYSPLVPTTLCFFHQINHYFTQYYFVGTNSNVHVWVFRKAIQANGEKCDTISYYNEHVLVHLKGCNFGVGWKFYVISPELHLSRVGGYIM